MAKKTTLPVHSMPGHLIRRLHQRSTAVFQKHMREAGHSITSVQFAALGALSDEPGIDQARIAALIAYDRATIGGVIERLEKRGLVERTVNDDDRRARIVTLTPEGEALYKALLPLVKKLQSDILAELSAADRAVLTELMARSLGMETPASDTDENRY